MKVSLILLTLFALILVSCEKQHPTTFTGKIIKKEIIKLETNHSAFQYNITYIQFHNNVYRTKNDTVYFMYNEGDEITFQTWSKEPWKSDPPIIYLTNHNNQSVEIER
jgi:hypothetical protein